MRKTISHCLAALAALSWTVPAAVQAEEPNINFGDDSGRFSKDGECDDMRFAGPGMTDTLLIDSDIFHDATDCRAAYRQGRLYYLGGHRTAANTPPRSGSTSRDTSHIQWGDDNGKYAKDGECDDKRFTGTGMTDTPLLDSDIRHDATDCRTAYAQGRLELRQ